MKKAVFLDRDGVLNNELGDYVLDINDFVVSEGVPEALKILKEKGFYLIVVTNQSGIAKGKYNSDLVDECHKVLQEKSGGIIDAFYFSPFHPDYDTESLLRKPDSLMIEKGAARFNINLSQSWMVGDKKRDIEAGQKAGCKTLYIYHKDYHDAEAEKMATHSAESLIKAIELIN